MLTAVPFPESELLPAESPGTEDDSDHSEFQIYRAIRFLKGVLAFGPLPSTWVMETGKTVGLPERTLRRARSRVNVRVLHSGGFGKGTRRFMALPADPAVAYFEQRKKGRGQAQEETREAALKRIRNAMQCFEVERAEKQAGVAR